MFLLHFPSGRPAPPLAGILPGGARTFLPPGPMLGPERRPPVPLAYADGTAPQALTVGESSTLPRAEYGLHPILVNNNAIHERRYADVKLAQFRCLEGANCVVEGECTAARAQHVLSGP